MTQHDYRIISRKSQGALADAIDTFLNDGWQLVGGLFIEQRPDGSRLFYQAILRTAYKPSIGKEAVLNHETGAVTYSEN